MRIRRAVVTAALALAAGLGVAAAAGYGVAALTHVPAHSQQHVVRADDTASPGMRYHD
jgi:hypothetical protein